MGLSDGWLFLSMDSPAVGSSSIGPAGFTQCPAASHRFAQSPGQGRQIHRGNPGETSAAPTVWTNNPHLNRPAAPATPEKTEGRQPDLSGRRPLFPALRPVIERGLASSPPRMCSFRTRTSRSRRRLSPPRRFPPQSRPTRQSRIVFSYYWLVGC